MTKKLIKAALPAAVSTVAQTMKLLATTQIMGDAQKKFRLAGSTVDVEARRGTAISTGLLMSDLILSGGIFPGGWYTFFGPEQSCKSTHMMTALSSLFYSAVPLIYFADAEGSTTPEYIEAIASASGVHGDLDIKRMFGLTDPKDPEKYIIEPRIHLFPDNSLENFYNSVSYILKQLPDKIFYKDEWWLLYERTKTNISRFSAAKAKSAGFTISQRLSKKYNSIAVKSFDGGTMQALFIVDSYPALVTDRDDESDDGDNALGVEARGHSKFIKKVKGKLKRKHAAVIGVNQLRDKPMAKAWEPKEYEPCGQALRFYSDCRISQRPRSVPHGKGQLEIEPSIDGRGEDTYRYIHMRAIKNKFGTPFLESFYRLWVTDKYGKGQGFCPVFDTYSYLTATGQMDGSLSNQKKKMVIKLPGVDLPAMSWLDFKALILLSGDELRDHCKSLGIKKNPKLREACFKQLKSGEGVELYFQTLHSYGEGEVEEQEYDDMTDAELVEAAVEAGLATRKKAKKMDRDDLLALLSVDEDEEDPDEEDE